jgi:hypothetical protein
MKTVQGIREPLEVEQIKYVEMMLKKSWAVPL